MQRYSFALIIGLLMLFSLTAFAQPANVAEYEMTSPSNTSSELYRGIPVNWHAAYALKEFNAYAAQPGSNWTWGESNRKFGPAAEDWVAAAKKNGWVTSPKIQDIEIGAMIVILGSYGDGYCGIVTEIHPNSFNFKMPNVEGLPSKFYGTFNDKIFSSKFFVGIILPRKTTDPATAVKPSVLDLKAGYKDLPQNWPPIHILKEFDKIAPVAVNWTNDPKNWPEQAQAGGLKTSTDINAAQPWSILITANKAYLVRAVYADRLIVEQATTTEAFIAQLKLADIKDFIAYIYPLMR
jgi:hypothetical protein